jgi:tetratricopeptide (TPR) repeat protein
MSHAILSFDRLSDISGMTDFKEKVTIFSDVLHANLTMHIIQGDEAFKTSDYGAAVAMYSAAIDADRHNQACYLNRSLANLKLERCVRAFASSSSAIRILNQHWVRWSDAEQDATEAIRLGYKGIKALYRRAVARREQGSFADALEGRSDLNKPPCTSY